MVIIAFVESREARRISANRAKGEADDDETEEWDELQGHIDMEREGWCKKVQDAVPDMEEDKCCQMVRALAKEVKELKKLVGGEANGGGGPQSEGDLLEIQGGPNRGEEESESS